MPIDPGVLTAVGALVGGFALAIERGLAVRGRSNGHDPTSRAAGALERLATLIERHEMKDESRHDEAMRAAIQASKDLDHLKTVVDQR